MKVTNISSGKVYLKDLRITNASPGDGRRGEDRYIGPGTHEYLPNTSEVLRSVIAGDIRAFVDRGVLTVEDRVDLTESGGADPSVVLTHNFRYPVAVVAFKLVGSDWIDATGTLDITHNADFTETTITNATAFAMTFLIRLI